MTLVAHMRPPVGHHARRVRARILGAALRLCVGWGVVVGTIACGPGSGAGASIPPAEAYDRPSRFEGIWEGEVDGTAGTLLVSPLGEGRYRGIYMADDGAEQYVLLLEQDRVRVGEASMLGNRTLFTWQDGHGARGKGWMLINSSASTITGALGEQGRLDRPITFVARDG